MFQGQKQKNRKTQFPKNLYIGDTARFTRRAVCVAYYFKRNH